MLDIVMALKDVFAQQHFDMVTDTGNYLVEPQYTHSEQPTRTVLAIDPSSLSVSAKPTSSGMRLKPEQISESQAQTLTGSKDRPEDGNTLATQMGVSLGPTTMTQIASPAAAWLKTVWLFAGVLVIAAATWTILDRFNASNANTTRVKEKPKVEDVVDVVPEQPVAPKTKPQIKKRNNNINNTPQAPVAQEPVVQEPVAQEPVVQEPVAQESPKTKKTTSRRSQKKAGTKKKAKSNSGFIRTTPKPSGFIRTSSQKEDKDSSFRRVQTE
jgi:hypothetical protein